MRDITSVDVSYKTVEDWHVFVCDEFPGLYVASQDREVAYRDVATSLQKLIKLEFDVNCVVTPEMPLRDFVASLQSQEPAEKSPAVLENHRYAVMREKEAA